MPVGTEGLTRINRILISGQSRRITISLIIYALWFRCKCGERIKRKGSEALRSAAYLPFQPTYVIGPGKEYAFFAQPYCCPTRYGETEGKEEIYANKAKPEIRWNIGEE